ncbi:MAG: TVP38/TMEM64 family protein [Rhodobacterales bacterium]|nr:TVP38/TMEM64 family protein [Rhodobacterales bacterium]
MSGGLFGVNPRLLLRGLLTLASLVAIGFLVKVLGADRLLDTAWIDNQVRGQGLSGELLFLGVGVVLTAVGLPRQMVSFLGGYAFGFVMGTLLALLATVGGCIATFAYARLLGRDLVAHRFPGRIKRIDAFLRDNTFAMALLIRLLPAGSNLVTNLAAGVSGARALPFFAGSALGFIPQTAVFTLAGSGINLDPTLRIGLGVVLFLVSGLIGVALYRRHRHGRSIDAELDAAIDEAAE